MNLVKLLANNWQPIAIIALIGKAARLSAAILPCLESTVCPDGWGAAHGKTDTGYSLLRSGTAENGASLTCPFLRHEKPTPCVV